VESHYSCMSNDCMHASSWTPNDYVPFIWLRFYAWKWHLLLLSVGKLLACLKLVEQCEQEVNLAKDLLMLCLKL